MGNHDSVVVPRVPLIGESNTIMTRTSQNAYSPPTQPSSMEDDERRLSVVVSVMATVGSVILIILGGGVAILSRFAVDGSFFFALTGLFVMVGGLLGTCCVWGPNEGILKLLAGWMSLIVNTALVIFVAVLILNGTLGGPLVAAAPLLICIPAAVNVIVAVFRFVHRN